MALVDRSGVNFDANTATKCSQFTLPAGEDIDAGALVRVDSAGEVVQTNASVDDANAKVDGIASRQANAGEPVTVYGQGQRLRYDDAGSLTPGATLFAAATDGRLDDTATTGDGTGVARAISTTDIVLSAKNL